ncbi:MAG: HipA family kinase [Mesobacillus sp.]|uniref:HipA family kinase n=1 Tax=Mesobacillus sp. TaxID=2675271 RepID=UPI003C5E2DAB
MINPVAYRRKLEGKSNSHLIAFDDGREYVVKFFQPGFERTLPNEWVSYCLARYLGLPIPFARLVEIPDEFTVKIPELAQMVPTQFQFASLFVPNCLDGHQVRGVVSGILNQETLAGIILFDYWMCNRDRTRKNILFQEDSQDVFQLWVIDHAEVLGSYDWQISNLENLPTGLRKSAAHRLMASFIENEEAFAEALELIQTIPIFLIEEIVSTIPDDWNVSKEEKKAMVNALVQHRTKILPKQMARIIKKVYHSKRGKKS